jgi:hypothetical protein
MLFYEVLCIVYETTWAQYELCIDEVNEM